MVLGDLDSDQYTGLHSVQRSTEGAEMTFSNDAYTRPPNPLPDGSSQAIERTDTTGARHTLCP